MSTYQIDIDFPGGNVVVERIDGDTVYIAPDLRDTGTWWFYWYFRVRGAAGRKLTFVFSKHTPIAATGAAVSHDEGWTWRWLGGGELDTFSYAFPEDASDVRFSMGMPYLQSNWERFVAEVGDTPYVQYDILCESKKGRPVERVRVGRLEGGAEHRILLTCRHHACEMMASYALEGLLQTALGDDETGAWFRAHAEILAIPFVDKDGVEDGDQGKNRLPRDHNRDYDGVSIHSEVAALREYVPRWAAGRLHLSLDMHCPGLNGQSNEWVYFPGIAPEQHTAALAKFSAWLEANQQSALGYRAEDNMPFGQGWNKPENYSKGKNSANWSSEFPENRLASILELPYGKTNGADVTADTARAFGKDLARGIRAFLKEG
jgi:hypothetical protein